VAPVARASWTFKSPLYTFLEPSILEQLAGTTVPPEKYAYFLGTGKEAMNREWNFDWGTANWEILLTLLERIWRDLPPNQVELIMERAREIAREQGREQLTLEDIWQATQEIAPPETIDNAQIPVDTGKERAIEIDDPTEGGSWPAAIVGMCLVGEAYLPR